MTMTREKIKLRDYQQECVDKIIWDLTISGNSLCVIPTGGGKSIIVAETVQTYGKPTLILQPSKEILEQNYDKLLHYVDPSKIGVYSASMGRKDVNKYTFATIQSIYKDPTFFSHFGLIIIDESHLLNTKSATGMLMKFIKNINQIRLSQNLPCLKIIGFTATPYRMETMYIDWNTNDARIVTTIKLINRVKGFFWSRILYNMSMKDLIDRGYLCSLNYIDASVIEQKHLPLNASRSEFDMNAVDEFLENKRDRIIKAIKYGEETSSSVLVFCTSVKQAESLRADTPNSEVITAKTKSKDRERIIREFKNHTIKTVFNVGVLTVGFDHPSLDCIILLRPTRSIMLYIQMLGRGVRIAEGKTSCKVIDLTSTVKNMGRVETFRLDKIDGKWDLISESGSWHAKELYSIHMGNDRITSGIDSNYTDTPPF